ncbi:conserved hypothetical protein [Neospora caninum Liverpool]|uniref:Ribonuclease H1/H2 small subunit protein n=1 Tax=Neospora caninum (strain Liverpool) TaxID=572307 RepID=F0VGE9_NEOCL|nr:conserved hypothetical protein [Neospora caninum Liverpool]CBZ52793.1 conserved hypothetical protein [Neospora caninum Liverpool]CEL66775.1 TPA: ribonuclease H1/H2 small subunit protein [Neospora caninum Liverpool]|eukprot:XP_003882825.1 conserved hypothetical protein [Neospora caninum Liverpool]
MEATADEGSAGKTAADEGSAGKTAADEGSAGKTAADEGSAGKTAAGEAATLFADSSWWDECSSSAEASSGAFGVSTRSSQRASPSKKRTASRGKCPPPEEDGRESSASGAACSGASAARKRKLSAASTADAETAAAFWAAAASQWRRRQCVVPCSESASVSSRVFGTEVRELPGDDRLGGISTAHVLPCKISFTGDAPVRRHFRPQVAYAVPDEDEAQTPEAHAPAEGGEAGNEGSATASASGAEDSRDTENVPPVSQSKGTLGPDCAASPAASLRTKKTDTARDAEKAAVQTPALSDTAPVVLEALLHGRLLRGLSLPLSRVSFGSKTRGKPEGQTSSSKDASNEKGWFLTEGCEGYVVAVAQRQEPDEGVEIEDDACEDAPAMRKEHAKADALKAADKTPPFAPRKELVPLGALSHLCYWQQDALPSPTDDMVQLLAFMRLVTAMHDWRDEMPSPEEKPGA